MSATNTFLLAAMGDALGWPLEFQSGKALKKRRPAVPKTLGTHGRFTDDTQMALFVAEGLAAALTHNLNVDTLQEDALIRWYTTQSDPKGKVLDGLLSVDGLFAQRAPGGTCMASCARLERGERFSLTHLPNDSKGCGVVMRSYPYGLVATSATEANEWAVAAGVQTHGHPMGYLTGAWLAVYVYYASQEKGAPRRRMVNAVDRTLDFFAEGLGGSRDLYDYLTSTCVPMHGKLADTHMPTKHQIENVAATRPAKGPGWVGEEALVVGLMCAEAAECTPTGVRKALWAAAYHNGDSDSTASICGALLGAAGYPVPEDWACQLELRGLIEHMATLLSKVKAAR